MKKLIIYTLLLAVATTFKVSCGGGTGPTGPDSRSTNSPASGIHLTQAQFGAVGASTYTTVVLDKKSVYTVTEDLSFTAGSTGDIILDIQSDNVILDLNSKNISSTRASSNLTAINVASGMQNVVIKNGKIQSIEGTGIVVGTNCQNVTIEDVYLESCDYGGISVSTSKNVKVNGVNSVNHASPTATDVYGLSLASCTNVDVLNSNFNDNGTTGKTGIGITLSSCSNSNIQNCNTSGNNGTSAYGIRLTTCTSMNITNCYAKNNVATTGTAAGIHYSSTSTDNVTESCEAMYNRATSAGGNAYGLYSTGGTANVFDRCVGASQSATTGIAFGIGLDSSETLSTVSNGSFYGNRVSSTGEAYGVRFASTGASVTKCCLRDSSIKTNNATASGATLAGFRDWSTDCNSLISGNTIALNGDKRLNVGSAPNYDIDSSDLTIDGSGNGGLNLYLTYTDSKNVVDMVVETDVSNLQAVSTALQGWTNILIVPSEQA